MRSFAMLQLNTIARNNLTACRRSTSSATPHLSRPTSLPFTSRNSNLAIKRGRFAHVQVHASQSPNPFGGGGNDNETIAIALSDLALPAAGLAFLLIAGPLFGGVTAIFGLPLIITGVAAAFGFLDILADIFGISPIAAAGIVASTCLGILLIPTFLKFGFIALSGYFVANLLFRRGSEEDSDVTPGNSSGNGSSYFSGSNRDYNRRDASRENDFDARDITIDVEAETIDD